ncbi:ATP-dependent RNA helicase RhlE [Cohnella sp. OV330]|uniref:DEAD/DEAH box helicase n=1 Tax=Cohnella sp. OV330 TaxID=1855288 RepID=UPI0008E098E9|nr:DEAD/DEAH box helicase [Cohnella sp. OV330]SFA72115.1 ATP-dependent RNA helicase RhlE [Cohnella sp. OV330]
MNFNDLKLKPAILKALSEENYTTPTPIQEQAIPVVLAGRDLFGCAQTGTGKTAAFSLPMLQLLSEQQKPPGKRRPIRSLVLTPTRELAIQIYDNVRAYGRHVDIRSIVIFGGVSQKPQEELLARGTDIVIATPGRLIDLMNQGFIDLSHVQILVLDEADRMLDMGFVHDVKRIIAKVPQKRQTLLFSATMPTEITKMVQTILVNPAKVEVTPVSSTAERIEQCVYLVDKANKQTLLLDLLRDKKITSALVFTRTKHGADRVVRHLAKSGVSAAAIHGNKSQNARQSALAGFKNGTTRILVATDIAARGIDIDELPYVINFNLPNEPETYVHRIGRTGRAGLSGIAISLCEDEELPYLRDIQKLIGKKIPEIKGHPYPLGSAPAEPKDEADQQRGGGRGRQGGGRQGAGQGGRAEAGRGGSGGGQEAGRQGAAGGRQEAGRQGAAGGRQESGRGARPEAGRGGRSDAPRGESRPGSGAARGQASAGQGGRGGAAPQGRAGQAQAGTGRQQPAGRPYQGPRPFSLKAQPTDTRRS